MRALSLALLALSGVAHAVGCSKIEYADARDWPLEKAAADYCRSGRLAKVDDELLRDLRSQGLLSPRDAAQYGADATSCRERQALFGRVIENVHRAPLPACS